MPGQAHQMSVETAIALLHHPSNAYRLFQEW
jgi:hypothetical protein